MIIGLLLHLHSNYSASATLVLINFLLNFPIPASYSHKPIVLGTFSVESYHLTFSLFLFLSFPLFEFLLLFLLHPITLFSRQFIISAYHFIFYRSHAYSTAYILILTLVNNPRNNIDF